MKELEAEKSRRESAEGLEKRRKSLLQDRKMRANLRVGLCHSEINVVASDCTVGLLMLFLLLHACFGHFYCEYRRLEVEKLLVCWEFPWDIIQ